VARFVDPDSSRTKIDALVDIWKEQCLIGNGSLLFDDRNLWTPANLEDFRERFLENPLVGTEENFGQKLATQLETATDDVRWLNLRVGRRVFPVRAGRDRWSDEARDS
jgi:5-methylcytosine-specific restriction protein B